MFFSRSVVQRSDSVNRLAVGVVAVLAALTPLVALADGSATGPVRLQSKANQNLIRVRMEMDVKGNVNVPDNPLVSRQSELSLPIKSNAVFDYEERYLRPAHADPQSEVPIVERFYHRASSSSLLNRNHSTLTLRDSVRHVVVRRESLPETIYASDDYFTSSELGLLHSPISSAAIDQLLPSQAVREGDMFQPPKEAIVSLLNLSSVMDSDLEFKVVSIEPRIVKLQFRGKIDGAVEGVPTVIRTVGKMAFDRQLGTSTWLAIALHETREIGTAEPGFDVVATIKMQRQPLPKTVGLAATPPPVQAGTPLPADRLFIDLQSQHVGVAVLLDRRWRMMSDIPGSAMLRMIETDRSIAQCNLRRLANMEPGKQLTLGGFQRQTRGTLGEQFSEMVQAEQRVSATGLRVLRVVAAGAVEGVPIQWTILHFSDDSGRRVLATFTMSADSVATFAGADLQFADSLRLLETDELEAVAARPSTRTQIAGTNNTGKPDATSDDEVQSPSDLR